MPSSIFEQTNMGRLRISVCKEKMGRLEMIDAYVDISLGWSSINSSHSWQENIKHQNRRPKHSHRMVCGRSGRRCGITFQESSGSPFCLRKT